MNAGKILIVGAHGLVGWALCAITMSIGMAMLPMQTALVVHVVAAPIFFKLVSLVYFRRFAYTTPLQTAFIFTGLVILLDFFLVALLINRSLAMFASPLGTWVPFAFIFTATYVVGLYVERLVPAPPEVQP
jgi:hypothetical protein